MNKHPDWVLGGGEEDEQNSALRRAQTELADGYWVLMLHHINKLEVEKAQALFAAGAQFLAPSQRSSIGALLSDIASHVSAGTLSLPKGLPLVTARTVELALTGVLGPRNDNVKNESLNENSVYWTIDRLFTTEERIWKVRLSRRSVSRERVNFLRCYTIFVADSHYKINLEAQHVTFSECIDDLKRFLADQAGVKTESASA